VIYVVPIFKILATFNFVLAEVYIKVCIIGPALALFLAFSIIVLVRTEAHQPRIVEANNITLIETREVSKAYYGALRGEPDVFIVEAQSSWNLYLEILVPDLPDAQKNKSVRIEFE
jgi:hypothetical protein